MFLFTWLQACFWTLLLSDARNDGVTCLPQLWADRTAAGAVCGEGRCRCADDGREARCLELTGDVTSLPRLPPSVKVLKLGFEDSFQNLTNDVFFYNASHITCLHLLRSRISSLNNRSFVWTTNLSSLHIGSDFFSTEGIEELLPLLSISTLRFLNASALYLTFPKTPDIFLPFAKYSHLEIIHFEKNNFDFTNMGIFGVFKWLKQLYLNSSFVTGQSVQSNRVLALTELYLDDSYINAFPKTCRGNKSLYPELEVLSLRNNQEGQVPVSDQVCLPRLRTLYIDFQYRMSADLFNDSRFPSLDELYMVDRRPYWGRQTWELPFCTFCNKNLHFLTLVANNIDFAQSSDVNIGAFAKVPRLQTLLLDHNNFQRMHDSLFQQLFGNLRSLRKLSLSNCHFQTFTQLTFVIFPNLATLNLDNNGVTEMPDGVFEPLPNLHALDLSTNRLATLSEGLFSPQNRQNLQHLFLGGNPFKCTCELMWFSKWMAEDPGIFDFPNVTYDCMNQPGISVPEYAAQEQACLLAREVSVLIVFSTSLVIATLTVFSLVYRYRWHVRMLVYEVFRGRDNLRRQRLLADHFHYDVFVSYASEDLAWVRQHVMPELEDSAGLRLCVHQRDFIPGKNIVDNIADCVQSSKKILVVYSKHFVLSPWCQFELTFCLRHVMDYDDALIIVCVDDVTSRRMTPAMMAVLKTTTYIQWAEEEDAVRSFWRRLRLALGEVTEQLADV